MDVTQVITISSYIVTIFAIILVLFVYGSLLWSKFIIQKIANTIKEKRREVIKLRLQDFSLYIQLSAGIGISFMLYALSLEGNNIAGFFLLGLIGITTSIFLLIWRYEPLRDKLYEGYNTKTKKK
jgi:hypothetical protein